MTQTKFKAPQTFCLRRFLYMWNSIVAMVK